MTTWKQYPHLFANGKFESLNYMEKKRRYKIMGCSCDGKQVELEKGSPEGRFYERFNQNVDYCALIARKIEDMTDEEINRHPHYGLVDDYKWAKEQIEILADSESINIESFLHLTDIGVYPFDQSHFETGDVIDIKTL